MSKYLFLYILKLNYDPWVAYHKKGHSGVRYCPGYMNECMFPPYIPVIYLRGSCYFMTMFYDMVRDGCAL